MALEGELSFFLIRGIFIIYALISFIFLIILFTSVSSIVETPKKEQLGVIYLLGLIFYLSILLSESFSMEILSTIFSVLLSIIFIYYLIIIFKFCMAFNEVNSNIKPIFGFFLLSFISPLGVKLYSLKAQNVNVQSNVSTYSPIQENTINQQESQAKFYIEQYKRMYSKEAILSGLISAGVSKSDAEIYIQKYY